MRIVPLDRNHECRRDHHHEGGGQQHVAGTASRKKLLPAVNDASDDTGRPVQARNPVLRSARKIGTTTRTTTIQWRRR